MRSILTSVKKKLGIAEDYTHFDPDLIIDINSVFTILSQLGVGGSEGFVITGSDESWDEFLPEGQQLEFVKSYVCQKVRMMFDPPLGSAVIESNNRIINELEWRIMVAADPKEESEEENQND